MGLFDALGTSLVSGTLGQLFNVSNAKRMQDFNISNLGLQRDINEYMYRNRYKWAMEDMRGAGLNPILAFGGSGFSTAGSGPSVSLASAPHMGSPDLTAVASSARSLAEAEEKKTASGLNIARIQEAAANYGKLLAQSAEALAGEFEKRAHARVLTQQEHLVKGKIDQVATDVKRMMAEISKIDFDKELIQWKANQIIQNIEVINQKLPELRLEKQIYEGPAGYWIKATEKWMKALSPFSGAVKSAQ